MHTRKEFEQIQQDFLTALAAISPVAGSERHAQAWLVAYPELRNSVFNIEGRPISFGYLMAASNNARKILVEMLPSASATTTQGEPIQQKLAAKDIPQKLRQLLPESSAYHLPSISAAVVVHQLLPFCLPTGPHTRTAVPVRRLLSQVHDADRQSLQQAHPSMRDFPPLPVTGLPPALQVLYDAPELHPGVHPSIAKLFPETALTDLPNYTSVQTLAKATQEIAQAGRSAAARTEAAVAFAPPAEQAQGGVGRNRSLRTTP